MQSLRLFKAERGASISEDHGRRALSLARAVGFSALLALVGPAFASATGFTDIAAGLTGVHHGSSVWGDYDGDGDLDALATGETVSPLGAFADIYQNNPVGTFAAIGAGFTPIIGSTDCSRSSWGDFNNDGLLDVIVTGQDGTFGSPTTTLYRNTGSGFVAETVTSTALQNVALGSASWGDYDNDGDQDLFLTGYIGGGVGYTTIYRNDGDNGTGGWTFTDINPFASYSLERLYRSDGAWGDYDNDGDLDLVVEGNDPSAGAVTTLFRNDGGVFVRSSFTGFTNVCEGSVSWGDLNNDGWLDLVLTGTPIFGGPGATCNVYTNNHNGTFTLSQALFGLCNSSSALGDYNNDGKLDLVVTGHTSYFGTPYTLAYLGSGSGTFTIDASAGLTGLYEGQVAFGDYDNDGRLDLILTGRDVPISTAYTKIYHNTTGCAANTLPTVPAGLAVTNTTWNSVTVQWSLSTDAQSPTSTLTYNLRVDDQTAGTTVMVPMSNTSTGYRQVPALGNTNHNANWTVSGLVSGHTYGFSVQSIDQAWAASALSPVVTTTTLNASTRPDAMIGDCGPSSGYVPGDLGVEPNTGCGVVYYNSPNIWIRKNPDGTLLGNDVPQNPTVGGTNYVYARVKNISPNILTHGKVYFYFAKAGSAFTWPLHWNGYYNSGTLEGDLIAIPGATAEVNYLSGGAETIAWVAWPNTPGFSHFCILARFVSDSDPMTYAEGSSTGTNTFNNNNIAWRNITVSTGSSGTTYHGTVNLNNISAEAAHVTLHVAVPDGEIQDPVLNHVQIKLHLGQDLYNRWIQAGAHGQGFEIPKDADNNGGPNDAVWITRSGATLEDIPMNANEQAPADLETYFPKEFDPTVAGNVYHLDLAQYMSGADVPDGGEFYEIDMPVNAGGAPGHGVPGGKLVMANNELAATLALSARPNPTSGVTTINYSLPTDSRVTVNLYDANGRMIRNLVPALDQQAGHHEVMWDGTAVDGRDLPSGVYFYRIRTAAGIAEGKITITH